AIPGTDDVPLLVRETEYTGYAPAVGERWATFDCYGTLVDWNAGIGSELERLWGRDERPRLVARYHELEHEIEAEDPGRPYREVLRLALERIAQAEALPLAGEKIDALARSLPHWPVFPEVPAQLDEARERGWRLASSPTPTGTSSKRRCGRSASRSSSR